MLWKKNTNLLAMAGMLVLLLYSGFLVLSNYRSQLELHQVLQQQVKSSLEKQALSLRYFFDERRGELSALARQEVFANYFINRDLGMSMEYGLRASLGGISRALELFLAEKRSADRKPYYQDVVFYDADRQVLAAAAGSREFPEWALKTLSPEGREVKILSGHQQGWQVLLISPYLFKGRLEGYLVAWLNMTALYENQLGYGEKPGLKGLLCEQGHVHCCESPAVLFAFPRPVWPEIPPGEFVRRKVVVEGNGDEWFILRQQLPNTPFSLVHILVS